MTEKTVEMLALLKKNPIEPDLPALDQPQTRTRRRSTPEGVATRTDLMQPG
jgi:hypothetical protein